MRQNPNLRVHRIEIEPSDPGVKYPTSPTTTAALCKKEIHCRRVTFSEQEWRWRLLAKSVQEVEASRPWKSQDFPGVL